MVIGQIYNSLNANLPLAADEDADECGALGGSMLQGALCNCENSPLIDDPINIIIFLVTLSSHWPNLHTTRYKSPPPLWSFYVQ